MQQPERARFPCLQPCPGFPNCRVEAVDERHGVHDAGTVGFRVQSGGVLCGRRQGLLADDGFAGGDRQFGQLGVCGVRSADVHHVYVVRLDKGLRGFCGCGPAEPGQRLRGSGLASAGHAGNCSSRRPDGCSMDGAHEPGANDS